MKKHLELEFEVKKNYQIYWDDVVMFCHFEEYTLGVRETRATDIIEVDDYKEYEYDTYVSLCRIQELDQFLESRESK